MSHEPLLVVAGEASGDLLGSRLLEELLARNERFAPFGLGGPRLEAAGLERIGDSSPLAVVGLVEALGAVPRALGLYRRVLREATRRRARAAVLIDLPEFNLRLARALSRRRVRVFYYVSPQIWAWRSGRVEWLRGSIARMLVLFPFEEAFYRERGIPVAHVGHPVVEEVPELEQAWDTVPPGEAPDPVRVVLLPGSRQREIDRHLPLMLDALRRLSRDRRLEASVLLAPGLPRESLDRWLEGCEVPVAVVAADRYRAVAAAHLALCASGTATLEVGLLRTPMVVLYRLAPLTHWLARRLVRIRHVSLVNLVLEAAVVPELLQRDASTEALALACQSLLEDRQRLEAMRSQLGQLRLALGRPGASARAADIILQEMAE